jgi:hypothetical protein
MPTAEYTHFGHQLLCDLTGPTKGLGVVIFQARNASSSASQFGGACDVAEVVALRVKRGHIIRVALSADVSAQRVQIAIFSARNGDIA